MTDFPDAWVEAAARALHRRIAVAGMPHRTADEQNEHADRDWKARPEADRGLFRAEARAVLAELDRVGALAMTKPSRVGDLIGPNATGIPADVVEVVDSQCECARRHPERYAAWAADLAQQLAEARDELSALRRGGAR